jgi:hypothetical protein
LRADDGLSQPAINKAGPERTCIAARTAPDTFFFIDEHRAGFGISTDGFDRTDEFAHGGFTLHAGGRNEFKLTVHLSFHHPNPGTLGIAFFHVAERTGQFAHLTTAAFVRIDDNNIPHSLSTLHFTLNQKPPLSTGPLEALPVLFI